jgi:hypothetical protein
MEITALIFSRDRAMQLDGLLRSLRLHCAEAEQTPITILYLAGSPAHAEQYRQLARELAGWRTLRFVAQQDFRRDVLAALTRWRLAGLSERLPNLKPVMWRLPRMPAVGWLRLRISGYVLFLVDDSVFVRDFSLAEVAGALAQRPAAIGFSLRLGTNTTTSYVHNRGLQVPAFERVCPGVLRYRWVGADADYCYSLELSSSVYRRADLLPGLLLLDYRNPNLLEARLALLRRVYARVAPELLCFDISAAFSAPVNVVQQQSPATSRTSLRYPTDDLARRFDAGWRIDVGRLSGFVPTGCHQDVAFEFVRTGPQT